MLLWIIGFSVLGSIGAIAGAALTKIGYFSCLPAGEHGLDVGERGMPGDERDRQPPAPGAARKASGLKWPASLV
jgi:hypothetical protein